MFNASPLLAIVQFRFTAQFIGQHISSSFIGYDQETFLPGVQTIAKWSRLL
ncbi:Uncharacterised protein [Escherichia coli]|uniref:Uncharacterized protein n=1 Tax=Escherichia coli TaxID=562 RepID=A0A376KPD9_ECOLX|nr:Uncharacterised protein [Escherichia coli]